MMSSPGCIRDVGVVLSVYLGSVWRDVFGCVFSNGRFRHGGHCGQGSPTRALGPSTRRSTSSQHPPALSPSPQHHASTYPLPQPDIPTALDSLSAASTASTLPPPSLEYPTPDSAASPPSCRPGCSKVNGLEALDLHSSSWCCWVRSVLNKTVGATR